MIIIGLDYLGTHRRSFTQYVRDYVTYDRKTATYLVSYNDGIQSKDAVDILNTIQNFFQAYVENTERGSTILWQISNTQQTNFYRSIRDEIC